MGEPSLLSVTFPVRVLLCEKTVSAQQSSSRRKELAFLIQSVFVFVSREKIFARLTKLDRQVLMTIQLPKLTQAHVQILTQMGRMKSGGEYL